MAPNGSRERPAGPLVDRLAERRHTLSLAESCTGGLASSLVTDVPGASEVLDRAIVAYTRRAKIDELGVDEAVLDEAGPVSEATARSMATGVRRTSGATWAASTTGIAGPTGGTEATPVGTVFVAVSGPDGADVTRYAFEGERGTVKRLAAEQTIDDLLDRIEA